MILDYSPILIFMVPLVGALLVPLVGKLPRKILEGYAITVALISAFLGVYMLPWAIGMQHPIVIRFDWLPEFGISLGVYADQLSLFMAAMVSFVSSLIVIYSKDYMAGDEAYVRYYFFILFFIGNMLGLIMAENLVLLFMFWEGVGLCSYGLIGFWNKDNENVRSGTKAFIVTRAGDVGLLAGIIIIYLQTHTLSFVEMEENIGAFAQALGGSITLVGLLLFAGAVGKSAQFPLNIWLPEAMAGPTTVSALIHAATMVKAGVYLIARFLPIFFEIKEILIGGIAAYALQVENMFTVIAWVGVFTAFMAGSMGMAARELKKVLAFSTVSQLGYMMMGLGVAGLMMESTEGYFASVFHMTAHMLFKALLFLSAGAVIHAVHTKDMFEMGGLKDKMPLTYKVMLIGALSLSGIPPLAGFFSKETLFDVVWIYAGEVGTMGLIMFIIAVVAAIFTFFYSLRMIGVVFFGKPSEIVEEHHAHDPHIYMKFSLVVLAALTLISGFFGPWIEAYLIPSVHMPGVIDGLMMLFGKVFTPISMMVLGTILVVGGVPGYFIYIKRSWNAEKIGKSKLHTFLYNRWYWNTILVKIFVNGFHALSRGIFNTFEKALDKLNDAIVSGNIKLSHGMEKFDRKGVDGVVNGIVSASVAGSKAVDKTQTGNAQTYLQVGLIGLVILLITLSLILNDQITFLIQWLVS